MATISMAPSTVQQSRQGLNDMLRDVHQTPLYPYFTIPESTILESGGFCGGRKPKSQWADVVSTQSPNV